MRQAYEQARDQGWSGTPEMWSVAWQVAQVEDARIADLSMLVRKLSLALRKAAPSHMLPGLPAPQGYRRQPPARSRRVGFVVHQ